MTLKQFNEDFENVIRKQNELLIKLKALNQNIQINDWDSILEIIMQNSHLTEQEKNYFRNNVAILKSLSQFFPTT